MKKYYANCTVFVIALILTGCATFEPGLRYQDLTRPRQADATSVQQGLKVSVEQFATESKAKMAFDADIASYGVLPLLVRVENNASQNYTVFRSDIRAYLGDQLLSPIMSNEAAKEAGTREYAGKALGWTLATGPFFIFLWPATIGGSAAHTQSVNKRIVQHFENLAFTDARLKPNQTAAGFIYFKLPDGVSKLHNLTVEVQPTDDKTGKRLTYKLNVRDVPLGIGISGGGTATTSSPAPEVAVIPRIEQGTSQPSPALEPDIAPEIKGKSDQPSPKMETALATKPPAYEGNWSRVRVPVYKDGDSWVFGVNGVGTPQERYRVTYKNGRFESSDPDFLTGNDDPDSLVFGPLVSVHLYDPEKKNLDFPLIPGKEWTFNYRRIGLSGRRRSYLAEAEVIGPVRDPVETPAGRFKVIEIRRTDTAFGRRELTYFYSPETKSVVKFIEKTGDKIEMELIKVSLSK